MFSQPLRSAPLIVHRKPAGAVSRELDVIRRVGVNEILSFDLHLLDIDVREFPLLERLRVLREVRGVIDRFVSSERNIKFAALIEAAKSVEARPIQIIEQFRRFIASRPAVLNELIESIAMLVEELLVVAHLDPESQAVLEMTVE